jgi:hypothetical protein
MLSKFVNSFVYLTILISLNSGCKDNQYSQIFTTKFLADFKLVDYKCSNDKNLCPIFDNIAQNEREYLEKGGAWQFQDEGKFIYQDVYGQEYLGWWRKQSNKIIEFQGTFNYSVGDVSETNIINGQFQGKEVIIMQDKTRFSYNSGTIKTISSAKIIVR